MLAKQRLELSERLEAEGVRHPHDRRGRDDALDGEGTDRSESNDVWSSENCACDPLLLFG